MTSYGTDISTFPDLDPTFTLVDSPRMVAECVLRRWTTPRGLLDYDPNAGFDIRQYLNANLSNATQLYALRRNLEAEAEKDERVLRCDCVLTFVGAELTIQATLFLAGGPFVLTAVVSAISVQLLSVTAA
jgi:hypothetical protein